MNATDTLRDLTLFLQSHGHEVLNTVQVTIQDETWVGAHYRTTHTWSPNQDAVRWGQAKAGETYATEAIYCIGKLPSVYAKAKRTRDGEKTVCFPNGLYEWYVAGYAQDIRPEHSEFNPFGSSFILRPWDIPGEPIDRFSSHPYVRVPMAAKIV